MLATIFAGAENSDWAFFILALIVDVVVLATLLPLTIEFWRRLWTRRLRAKILHTALRSYLEAVATLQVEPGNLSAQVLRTRIIEAVQASRRRFSDVMPTLMPALDPDSQELAAEANSAFTDVLNFIETRAWRAQVGRPRPDTFTSTFAAQYEIVLRDVLKRLRERASRLNGGVGLPEGFDDTVLDNIFATGMSVDVLWNRVEAADERRRDTRDGMFDDLDPA